MAPPAFSDLGKSARDIFAKGYHFGLLKLDAKTTTHNGVNLSANISQNPSLTQTTGFLETNYKSKDYGLTISEKWHTDCSITSEVSLEDNLMKGLKLGLDSSFTPSSGKKSAVLKTAYKHDMIALNTNVVLNPSSPIINGSVVAGHQGFLAGYQYSLDAGKKSLLKSNFALGYTMADFTAHINCSDYNNFLASFHRNVSADLQAAAELSYNSHTNHSKFAIGAMYKMDADSCVRAKINNYSEMGISYQQKIRKGVTLTFSGLVDGKNVNQGGHKLGLALELEA